MTLLFLGHTYEFSSTVAVACQVRQQSGLFLGNNYQMRQCSAQPKSTGMKTLKYRGVSYQVAV